MSQKIYINPFNRDALRNAVAAQIAESAANFNYAITLTFPDKFVKTREEAQQRCSKFRDNYNAVFKYKPNHRRAAKHNPTLSAPFVAMIEGDGKNVHLHYHIALHKPDHVSHERYSMIINLLWYDTLNEQRSRITVEPVYSTGWAEYITKEFSTGNTDALDEKNYNVY